MMGFNFALANWPMSIDFHNRCIRNILRSICPLRVLGLRIECKQTLDFVLFLNAGQVCIYANWKNSMLRAHLVPKDVYCRPSKNLYLPDVNCTHHAHQARA